jgi:hypothetical protein
MIKSQLQKDILLTIRQETPVDDAIDAMIDFSWLNTCQERDIREVVY